MLALALIAALVAQDSPQPQPPVEVTGFDALPGTEIPSIGGCPGRTLLVLTGRRLANDSEMKSSRPAAPTNETGEVIGTEIIGGSGFATVPLNIKPDGPRPPLYVPRSDPNLAYRAPLYCGDIVPLIPLRPADPPE